MKTMSAVKKLTRRSLDNEKRQLMNRMRHRDATPEEKAECKARIDEINVYILAKLT
jgi:hypothetical protein